MLWQKTWILWSPSSLRLDVIGAAIPLYFVWTAWRFLSNNKVNGDGPYIMILWLVFRTDSTNTLNPMNRSSNQARCHCFNCHSNQEPHCDLYNNGQSSPIIGVAWTVSAGRDRLLASIKTSQMYWSLWIGKLLFIILEQLHAQSVMRHFSKNMLWNWITLQNVKWHCHFLCQKSY